MKSFQRDRSASCLVFGALMLGLAVPSASAGLDPQRQAARESLDQIERGQELLLRGRSDAGMRTVERALRSPRLPDRVRVEGLVTLCAAHAQVGQFERALARCDAAQGLGGYDWRIHTLRGIALAELGDLDQAIDEYRRALAIRPGTRSISRNLRAASRALALRGSTPEPRELARPASTGSQRLAP